MVNAVTMMVKTLMEIPRSAMVPNIQIVEMATGTIAMRPSNRFL